MIIKDIRNFNVKIVDGDNVLYEGNVDYAPDDIKNLEYKNVLDLTSSLMILEI